MVLSNRNNALLSRKAHGDQPEITLAPRVDGSVAAALADVIRMMAQASTIFDDFMSGSATELTGLPARLMIRRRCSGLKLVADGDRIVRWAVSSERSGICFATKNILQSVRYGRLVFSWHRDGARNQCGL